MYNRVIRLQKVDWPMPYYLVIGLGISGLNDIFLCEIECLLATFWQVKIQKIEIHHVVKNLFYIKMVSFKSFSASKSVYTHKVWEKLRIFLRFCSIVAQVWCKRLLHGTTMEIFTLKLHKTRFKTIAISFVAC